MRQHREIPDFIKPAFDRGGREALEKLVLNGLGQYPFQWNFSTGQILNLGCGTDGGELWTRGSINLDMHLHDVNLGWRHAVDVLGDIRKLPFKDGIADTIVISEVIEHFDPINVPPMLIEVSRCLKPGGRILATIPEDHREPTTKVMFADGISVQHHLVTPRMICRWCELAELDIQIMNRLHYPWADGTWFDGYGVIATRSKDQVHTIPIIEMRQVKQ